MKVNSLFLFFLLILRGTVYPASITLDGASISFNEKPQEIVQINEHWRFSIGDQLEWSKPNFNYSKWDTIYLPFNIEELSPFKYRGNLWIRTTFVLKNELVSKPLSLSIHQFGASEIYIDGKLIHQFGKVGNSVASEELFNPQETPVSFSIDSAGIHTIAVRYSNHEALSKDEAELNAFNLTINNTETGILLNKIRVFKENILAAIGIGIFLTLCIINFILFIFYKRDKSNLYYSIFSLAIAATFTLNALEYTCNSASVNLIISKLKILFLYTSNLFLVALVYSFIFFESPKRFKTLISVTIIGIILIFINFDVAKIVCNVLNIYCAIDIAIVVLKKYTRTYDPTKQKRKRFWLIILSLVVLAIIAFFINKLFFAIILGLLVLIVTIPIAGIIFIVPLYMTVRHAKQFSITNKNLEEQLIQVKELSEKAILQEQEKKKMLESENERLEQMVDERTAELAEKNHEIKDSINYALRIQKAILTSKEEINEGLKKCFILFKPKDIVSGDFYFYSKFENNIIIAAADCTGHGVPGALMSMIGSEKLMSTAKESTSPSVILNSLNKGIKSSLRQTDKEESTKDGMDIALVSIDLKSNKASYAGANRPIWIIRNNSKELEEIKATKKAIGGFTDDEQNFEQHELQFNTGDTFYLFTDGYADQFGHSGKKLMTKRFREMLIDIQCLSMFEQEKHLNDFIENWKQDTEQVDDILVIGVRI